MPAPLRHLGGTRAISPKRRIRTGSTFEGGIEVVVVMVCQVRLLRREVLALQHCHEALVDADVLLLRLDHPDALLAHGVHHAEDVDGVGVRGQLLQRTVQRDEGAGAAHAGRAVHHHGPRVGRAALAEGAHEARQRRRRVRHAEVRPRGEVEVLDHALLGAAAHHQLRHRPVGEAGLVEAGDGDVAVVHGPRVVRPVAVALLATLLHAARQHDDGAAATLPAHAPEVVPRRVQRALRDDELARRVVARHVVGVDVVRALLVVHRLQLEARVVVRQDVGEAVLGPVAWQVRRGARLVAPYVLQLLELLAESACVINKVTSGAGRVPDGLSKLFPR